MDETKVKLDAIRKLLELPEPTSIPWKKYPESWPDDKQGQYVLGIYENGEEKVKVGIFSTGSRIGLGFGEYKPLWYIESLQTPDGKEVLIKDR